MFAKGEPNFRAQELRVLESVANSPTASVISLGGGTWIQPQARKLVPAERVIFVDAPIAVLQARLGNKARPLASDPIHFRSLYEQRLPIYRSAGHILTITNGEPPEESARRLAHLIQQFLLA